MTEEQLREKTLQQLRRVFEMARTEIG
jgi:hypothetical protein